MLRRIPSTPLVCLVLLLTTILAGPAWAAAPDESLEILLKPNQAGTPPAPVVQRSKATYKAAVRNLAACQSVPYLIPPPGITKVKAGALDAYYGPLPCFLPTARMGQWEFSAQAFYGRVKGTVAWPRYNQFYNIYRGYENWADLNDDLKLPARGVVPQFTAKYQFKPNWALRYSVFGNQFNGGDWVWDPFIFGNQYYNYIVYGQPIQTKYDHIYQKVGLVYDAIRNCRSVLSISGNWVHVDDKVSLACVTCGFLSTVFSKSVDAAMVEMQFQRCIKTAPNGGTLSMDNKAGVMFLDDTQGWDVELGGRYTVPLNCGRWGYMKGGYRLVQINKATSEYLLKTQFEGGFVEGGFIF